MYSKYQGARTSQLRQILLSGLSLLLVLAIQTTIFAQQDLARVEGTVKDETGAVISGATIKISSAALNVDRSSVSSAAGNYSIPQLRPSVYTMSVTANGFAEVKLTEVVLGVGQTRSLDIVLKPSAIATETINIVASEMATTVDSSSNRLGVNVTEREVKELPVNGRNFSQLQLLTPGATNVGSGNFNEIRFNARSNQQNGDRKSVV